MGFFGLMAGHIDDGDDEAGLTCMISNSRIPDDYEPGRFHLFGSGMYTVIKPNGVDILPDATHLMIVFYCPKVALSPNGTSMPLASLPNGTPLLLGPEVTNPLCNTIFSSTFLNLYGFLL